MGFFFNNYLRGKMNVAVTGSSGFIASRMKERWAGQGFRFFDLKRTDSDEVWKTALEMCDVVVNFAGAPVLQRWTKKNRVAILSSRVATTRRLVSLLNLLGGQGEHASKLLISVSAIGIYPNDGSLCSELSTKTGTSFLTEVVKAWEAEAINLTNPSVRLVVPRIGVVFHPGGGVLKRLLPLFRMGLGGRLASGKQVMSFIHIDDLLDGFLFFIENKSAKGTFNMVAPETTTNAEFTRVLAKLSHRPAFFVVPAFALRLLWGKASGIVTEGENVQSVRLHEAGFTFQYPTIEKALAVCVNNAG